MNKLEDFNPSNNSLEDKVILITGAGSGIGRALSIKFSQMGANLILLSRDLGKLENVYEEIIKEGHKEPLIHSMDFENPVEENFLVVKEAIEEKYGKLDGLLNNAGFLGDKSPLDQYKYSLWKKVFNINVDSTFLLTKALMPLLKNSDMGSIIFTSSGVGKKGKAYWGAYAISKFATEGMMQVFADELENTSNLRINCVNPGAVRTKMREAAYPAEDPNSNPPPEQILNLYIFLMSDESKEINGQSINAQ
ncbi:MAG TPA: YciK family oxidoreductase [SAR86 cluster bacterium]|mgnify:FL=1|nr:YciK family oxidoreductase [SAR86 cluster bacterium]|tara:strand:- start:94 stop:843 length:750 start_codon:yes stop_codon:yes gene_type:complete